MMRIAIVGSEGQLGAALVEECVAAHDVIPLAHGDLDITADAAVLATLEAIAPDAIVNCAAYNDVDGAEDRPVDALNLNALAVRAVARAAEHCGAALVHYSTDFVFDGAAASPYAEDDRPNPRSVYATSKLLGEWFALENRRAFVVRVESLFGRASHGRPAKGTVASMVNAMLEGREVRAFEDRTVTPTFVIDAARATRHLLEREPPAGIYHCVNTGTCTWVEFANELGRRLTETGMVRQPVRIQPARLAEARLRAERPLYCALSNAKLAAAGIPMPPWQDAVERYAAASIHAAS
jgi:dTDP-4-dehydrorhamnose reductase